MRSLLKRANDSPQPNNCRLHQSPGDDNRLKREFQDLSSPVRDRTLQRTDDVPEGRYESCSWMVSHLRGIRTARTRICPRGFGDHLPITHEGTVKVSIRRELQGLPGAGPSC
jgi:hypothetical protein